MLGTSFGGRASIAADSQPGSGFSHDGKVVHPGRQTALPSWSDTWQDLVSSLLCWSPVTWPLDVFHVSQEAFQNHRNPIQVTPCSRLAAQKQSHHSLQSTERKVKMEHPIRGKNTARVRDAKSKRPLQSSKLYKLLRAWAGWLNAKPSLASQL